ncbi:MAG: LamG domain-containing protein [Prevotellaceae bacterium]|jgi:hypothetical protein|nr:LamG domain-containing protein [Prevotellaceae bacterium]
MKKQKANGKPTDKRTAKNKKADRRTAKSNEQAQLEQLERERLLQKQQHRAISISIVALLASVAAYAATAKIALLLYHPSLEQAIEIAKKTLTGEANPEPVESFLYNIGVLSIPLFMVGFFLLLTKTKLASIGWERYFKPLSVGFVLLAAGLLYAGLQATNPNFAGEAVAAGGDAANSRDVSSDTNFKFYFAESILSTHLWIYLGLCVPLIFGLMLLFRYFHKHLVKPLFMQIVGTLLVLGYAAVYTAQVYQIFSFDFPYTWENKYDFNTIYYPITQVYAGSPMLVDGFAANYGLYAHFLAPVFRLIGLDVGNATAVMAALIAVALALTLAAMLRTIKSKLLVALGFSTILFLCLLLSRAVTPFDAYFALFPVRQLLPAATLCMAAFYLKNRGKILYFAAPVLLGFGILWNPEFGIVCFLSWVAMLCYAEFSAAKWKSIAVACGRHIALSIGIAAACIAAFSLLIYLRYGAWPQLPELFNSMIYFGSLGGGMLPMTLRHPWNFVMLVYLVGLIYAVQALFNKATLNAKSAFILLLSVMGIGLFTYFQGRSHNWNLLAISGNAIILLAIFADTMLEKVKAGSMKQRRLLPAYLAVIAIVAVLGFSCIDLFRHQDKWKSLYEQKAEKKANIEEQRQVESNIAFIAKILPETTEKIYIHTSNKYQALYFDATKKRSAFNPSILDIFTIENCTRLQNKVILDSSDVFVEPTKFYYSYVQGINAAMCATYSVDTANGQMAYMKKRRYRTPEQPVLDSSQSPQVLVYEKFGDDTASLNRRIRCATEGREPLAWGDQLSIEIVFFAGQQAYQAGTLFSNYNDSAGVWLLNNGAPEQYLFQWSKNLGVSFQLEPNRWHYLALQANKNMLSIYVNGNLLNHYIIPSPIASTDGRFYIANEGRRNLHFTGAISEILVKKGLSSPQEIQARQKKIRDNAT